MELSKRKQEILKKVREGKLSDIDAKKLLRAIEEKENSKIVEK
jgi:hypothetical protein